MFVGFVQELSHTHDHTTPARETMNTRISGDESPDRHNDLYVGYLLMQKHTLRHLWRSSTATCRPGI